MENKGYKMAFIGGVNIVLSAYNETFTASYPTMHSAAEFLNFILNYIFVQIWPKTSSEKLLKEISYEVI